MVVFLLDMTSLRIVCVATALYVLASGLTTAAQSSRGEHWVGTWGTAVVPRPQPAPGAAPGRGAAPLNFNNQTLRQIVHVSLGGSRVRVVLSNAFGTSPLACRWRKRCAAPEGSAARRRVDSAADIQRQSRHHGAGGRNRDQRSGKPHRPRPRRRRDLRVPSGQHRGFDLTVDHAQRCAADQLRVRIPAITQALTEFPVSANDAVVVLSVGGRGHSIGAGRRSGRLRRFDYRRNTFDAGHQQPLAGSSGSAG